MSAFEAQINVTNVGIGNSDDDKALIVNLGIGMALPLAQPGTDRPLQAPLGSLTFTLDRDSAIQMGKQLQEEGEKLKPASKLEVASSMKQADKIGTAMKGIAGS